MKHPVNVPLWPIKCLDFATIGMLISGSYPMAYWRLEVRTTAVFFHIFSSVGNYLEDHPQYLWLKYRSDRSFLSEAVPPPKMNGCPLAKGTILKGHESSSKSSIFNRYVSFHGGLSRKKGWRGPLRFNPHKIGRPSMVRFLLCN